jgi:nucleoside-triphosphatase
LKRTLKNAPAVVGGMLGMRRCTAYVIDEIGKMESLCPKFVQTVPRLLGRPVPVVGTVAWRGGGLVAAARARPDVRLVEVMGENRNGLPAELEAWARGMTSDRHRIGPG